MAEATTTETTRQRAKPEEATKANIIRLTNAILTAVSQLGEQGNRGHHSEDEQKKVFEAIDNAIERAADKFANPTKKASAGAGFTL